jgi:hypothetical protein
MHQATESSVASTRSRRGLLSAGLLAGAALLTRTSETQAATSGVVFNPTREFRDIRKHENDHVAYLVKALGNRARPKPTFKNLRQKSILQFRQVSQALENTGVGAYLGATPAITSKEVLAAAASVALIEARHAGFLNVLNSDRITDQPVIRVMNQSFETPLTPEQVRRAAGPFIANLNGGPPVDFNPGDDISILNYALALEYLEAEFYNINVPRFYP